MDVSGCSVAKENIFSVGDNINVWSTTNDGYYNLHFYFPHSLTDKRLRFSVVIGEKVSGATRRTMGILPIPDETNLIIRFDKDGFWINGTLINVGDYQVEDDRPSETYGYFMEHFRSGSFNFGFGSRQGNNRSFAYYYYVKYHKVLD